MSKIKPVFNRRASYSSVEAAPDTRYEFSLAVYTSFDGGEISDEKADLKIPSEWIDPALTWDVSQDGCILEYCELHCIQTF